MCLCWCSVHILAVYAVCWFVFLTVTGFVSGCFLRLVDELRNVELLQNGGVTYFIRPCCFCLFESELVPDARWSFLLLVPWCMMLVTHLNSHSSYSAQTDIRPF